MMSENLHKAKAVKNDEFYTLYSNVEAELKHYEEHFKGKVVYSNCDTDDSAFVKYFRDNGARLGLKRFIHTSLEDVFDFRSDKSIEQLKRADIVVTNPPFSLFREYIAQLIEYDKDFLVIGNMNAITYKEIFPLVKDNKLWLGCTHPKEFTQPDGTIKKFGNIDWFTNLSHKKRKEDLILYKQYDPEEYPKYDNYDAINVDKVKDIPVDYDGVMGVPITFLDKWNPKQFEILGSFDVAATFNVTHGYTNLIFHAKNKKIIKGINISNYPLFKINKLSKNRSYYEQNKNYFIKPFSRLIIQADK